MEDHDEVTVPHFIQLMRDYLEGRIDAGSYQESYFVLMKKRMIVSEAQSRVLRQAYGDADDYDPVVRLQYTIEEPELRRRVAKSLEQLTMAA